MARKASAFRRSTFARLDRPWKRMMRRKSLVIDDPVVAEVRAVRAALWKEGGGTAAGFRRVVEKIISSSGSGKQRVRRHRPKS